MERRIRPRTPGWTYGVVRWDTGQQVNAIVWDISDGGVAVEVSDDVPTASAFLLGLSYGGTQVAFPLAVVSRDDIDGRPLIHARFEALSETHAGILRVLIADWSRDMDRRQRWLTTRQNDPASRADMHLPGDIRPRKAG
jgi:hypothetical protein